MRTCKSIFYLIISLLLLTLSSEANNLRQISNYENLSNNSIESLHQDKSGKLWIGTCDGLNIYNGRKVEVYQPIDKNKILLGNIIDNIIETHENILWVQTYHGLNKLNRETNSIKYYNEFKQKLHIAKDKKNTLFIVQDDNFIQYYDDTKQIFQTVPLPGIAVDNLLRFTIDKDDRLWLTYKNGKNISYSIIYSNNTISFKENSEITHEKELLYSFYSNNESILVDTNYDLYSYNLYDLSKTYHYNLKEMVEARGEISSMIISNENIFIGYKTNGVQILVKQHEEQRYEIENIPINCGVFTLLKDKYQDIVWIGTDGQGVYIYSNDVYTIRSTKIKDYIAQIGKPIRSIFKDQRNTLWIGTKGDGIIKILDYDVSADLTKSRINRITTENSQLIDNSVYCTKKSNKNILWVGTEYGLNYYSYDEKRIKKVKLAHKDQPIVYIHDVYEQDSVLWIATVGMGIVKAHIKWKNNEPILDNVERLTIYNEDIGSNYFFSIYHENDSTIWFANRGYGAFKVNAKTLEYNKVSFSNKKNNKTLNEIFSITKDQNNMYFGTSAGLIEYQSENNFRVLDNSYGFPNNTIHSILKEDSDDSFWLSTNRGVVNYNPKHDTFRNYGLNDGLGVMEFSDGATYKDEKTGIVYFGGVNGFVSILKNRPHENEYMPNLTFDALTIYGRKENINDYLFHKKDNAILRLESTQNFITIDINAIDFLDANNYSFIYKIEGTNDQWIDNGNNNTISLTNLNHGEYKLSVKYLNRVIGKISPEYSLSIKISPPWYLSTTASITYVILLITSLFLIFKYLDSISERKRRRMIRKLEVQHKDEVYESKLGFFTSIAHEFCTPLTLIYGPCNQILEQQEANPRIRKYAEVILRNAERLNSLIQELIEFRKIETDNKPPVIIQLDVTQIVNDVIFTFKELADTNNAKFYKTTPNEIKWNSDREHLVTIVTNLLSNAFKYMSEAGTVEVEVKEDEDNLVIRISNTGKGIKKDDLDKIFDRHLILDTLENSNSTKLWSRNGLGLAISNSMVKDLKGTIKVESTPNEWTHFIVTLPHLERSIEQVEDNIMSTISIAPPAREYTQEALKLTNRKIDSTKRTLLVVDDEIDILWFIFDMFSNEYNVITTSSPLEVKSVLNNIHPDIILCDINMPKLDGIELTSIIKNNKHTAHIPLIIISAKQGMEEQIKGITAGAELYITKPFNVEYLRLSVERLLNRKKTLKEYFTSSLSVFEMNEGRMIHSEDNKFVREMQQIINTNVDNSKLNANFIAEEMNISTRNLYRRLAEIDCKSISDLIRDSRLHTAENLLLQSKKTIDEIIYDSGFGNRMSFYNAFSKKHKCTPTEYRETNIKL